MKEIQIGQIGHIYSPHLARWEDARDFVLEVQREPEDQAQPRPEESAPQPGKQEAKKGE